MSYGPTTVFRALTNRMGALRTRIRIPRGALCSSCRCTGRRAIGTDRSLLRPSFWPRRTGVVTELHRGGRVVVSELRRNPANSRWC